MADKAVFIDRDNTLTVDPGYLNDPAGVRLLPGVAGALKRLAEADFKLICVTNQSGIARGLLDEEMLEAIHAELRRQLGEQGAYLDAIYYCPHHPEGTVPQYTRDSDDRKPGPGMLLKAAAEMGLDLDASWMVGDRPRDVEAGRRAGCRTVRVLTGDAEEAAADGDVPAEYTTANFVEAARVIIRGGSSGGRLMPPAPPTAKVAATETPPPSPPSPSPPPTPASAPEAAPSQPAPRQAEKAGPVAKQMSNNEILMELLRHARRRSRVGQQADFSITKLIAGVFEGVALLAFAVGLLRFLAVGASATQSGAFWNAMGWLAVASVLQLTALTFFMMGRRD